MGTATGLNKGDVNVAITQPRKVEYLEKTVRSIEQGNLKIRVRSLENERALSRLQLSQDVTNKVLITSVLLNIALSGVGRLPSAIWYAAAGIFGAQSLAANLQISLFDKKAAKYESKDFN